MDVFIKFYVFVVGVLIGSFLNVCIYRIPKKKSIIYPSSSCPNCNNRLEIIDLIPVISYLIFNRRCRHCKEAISFRYIVVELLTGLIFLSIFYVYGVSIEYYSYIILASILITITFIDIDYYIIPDELILVGGITALLFNFFHTNLGVYNSIMGGLVCGGIVMFVINIIENFIRKEVMGRGDIKLFTMIGLFLGVEYGIVTIIVSVYICAFYGIVTISYSKMKKKNYKSVIPYGPFISLAAIITVVYKSNIIYWYINLF